MSSEYYYIQGRPVPAGQPLPSRMNFNQWVNTPNPEDSVQVSLFIRALLRFYKMDYHKMTSYFQVAGIHGYPSTLGWNNEKPGSYCVHGEITFPTWHRPYMLLFEQRIYELMREVIDKELRFQNEPEKDAWLEEANSWRLPYWDWAAKDSQIPELFTSENIEICAPTGSKHQYDHIEHNPLFRYQLQDELGQPQLMGSLPLPYTISDDVDPSGQEPTLPWSQCSGTSRWAVKNDGGLSWSPGVNNFKKANEAIKIHRWYPRPQHPVPEGLGQATIGELVARMLSPTWIQTWHQFATTKFNSKDPWKAYLSLEYIHNNLHNWIGGTDLSDGAGHMGDVPVAAFDPVFWIHHCNIDRLFAMWQTLNPEVWWATGDSPGPYKKLTPFYHEFSTGPNIFDSNDVRVWTKFGHQYDMLQRKAGETNEEYIRGIRTFIDHNYATTAPVLLHDPSTVGSEKLTAAKQEFYDYIVDVIYDRFALGGSPYTLYFFLGDMLSTSVNAINAGNQDLPRFVGSVYTFSRRLTGEEEQPDCVNCAKQAKEGSLSTAQVVLTDTLYYHVAAGNLNSMAPDEVQPYLEKNLQWVAISSGGSVIEMQRLPRTKVYVLKGKAKHYDEDGKPTGFESYKSMAGATDGKPGGASPGEYDW